MKYLCYYELHVEDRTYEVTLTRDELRKTI